MTAVIARPSLAPQLASSLEWWFVHGRLDVSGRGPRDFMISLFRQAAGRGSDDGAMLLLSMLDPATGQHALRSEVSRSLVDNFVREAAEQVGASAFDDRLVDIYVREIAEAGPPRPICMNDAVLSSAGATDAVAWRDVRIHQEGAALRIAFTSPEGDRCSLVATPRSAWFEGRDLGGGGVGSMAYDCCPRLSLEGSFGGEPVEGEGWFDHQWGGHGWLKPQDGAAGVLGWDWLGINLDDGRDILAIVHREMRTRRAVAGFAVIFSRTGPPRMVRDVTFTAKASWTSVGTMIEYPVEQRLEIPSLALDLAFSPSAPDQEVPVFGLINAIWEGSGTVTGTISGRRVAGRARLELHGYGYLIDHKAYMRRWARRIDRTLEAFLPRTLTGATLDAYLGPPRWSYDPAAQTEMLSAPVWDLLARGGKHWRPIFGLLLLDALGVSPGPYERMFSVIGELVHNGSVIIDDIEDASLIRRGEPTVHVRYGVPAAINAGNLLYFLPLLTIAETPELSIAQREAIYRIVFERFIQAHFGQAQDLYWSQDRARGMAFWNDPALGPLILQGYAFKTAAPVRAIADVACVIAEPGPSLQSTCVRLADSVGVAFQIVDDIKNFGSASALGKVVGEDLASGKVTYVLHTAVRRLEGADKRRLVEILDTPALRVSAEGKREGIALVRASGALATCRLEAEALADEDWRTLTGVLPASLPKMMLRLLFSNLLGVGFEEE